MASFRSIQTTAQRRFTRVVLFLLLFPQLRVYLSSRWLSQAKYPLNHSHIFDLDVVICL